MAYKSGNENPVKYLIEEGAAMVKQLYLLHAGIEMKKW